MPTFKSRYYAKRYKLGLKLTCYISLATAILLVLAVGDLAGLWALKKERSYFSDEAIEKRLATIHQLGLPATIQDVEATYPVPAAEDNGAPLLEQAFEALNDTTPTGRYIVSPIEGKRFLRIEGDTVFAQPAKDMYLDLPPPPDPISPLMQDTLERLASKNQRCIALINEALIRTRYHFSLELATGCITDVQNHYLKLRELGKLLNYCAILAGIQHDSEKAGKFLVCAFRITQIVSSEPFLDSQYCALSMLYSNRAALERILTDTQLTESQLSQLQQSVPSLETLVSGYRLLATERCLDFTRLRRAIDYEDFTLRSLIGHPSRAPRQIATKNSLVTYLDIVQHVIDVSRKPSQNWDCELEALMSSLESSWSTTTQSTNDSGAEVKPVAVKRRRKFLSLTASDEYSDALTLEMMRNYAAALQRLRDRDSLALFLTTAIAVERYRLEAGHLPNSVDEIVPKFLTSVSPSSYAGQDLRYFMLDAGFVVCEDCSASAGSGSVKRESPGSPGSLAVLVRR